MLSSSLFYEYKHQHDGVRHEALAGALGDTDIDPLGAGWKRFSFRD